MDFRTRIQELERENAQLRQQLQQQEHANTELREQLGQGKRELEEWKHGHRVRPRRTRRHCPVGSGKKPGRQRGHSGSGRPYPQAAEVEREEPQSQEPCPRCGPQVVPTGEAKTQSGEELVPARRRVVAHRP
jgi:hypothetical protein